MADLVVAEQNCPSTRVGNHRAGLYTYSGAMGPALILIFDEISGYQGFTVLYSSLNYIEISALHATGHIYRWSGENATPI